MNWGSRFKPQELIEFRTQLLADKAEAFKYMLIEKNTKLKKCRE